ncbi:MAG: tyrosine--tRNA ligase [Actinomycetales bacterium]|uniref:Tyrosine--tRNA ligase n=1 Tax=Candidatus Phosphoribacter hodrii TaxID=2953743 RepID=A0A935IPR3_9MICO|nr:tyrosine--tRNA ligase [Candidatus Phosphoribacter hodrii]OPZ54554.1 MAG: Tyrosine--tRNA ligase [bacterium ADurb.BinA028]HNV15114.1 tyrosine--tRNA ligase [Dermatophilaceae bacterium]MBK7272916.1 tyrosine--tRNA ligase [Candidatus Phosphoribacter hodrii]HOA03328.1 tyrosine--tRNA ligase [Dermatophilaceae bacterium]
MSDILDELQWRGSVAQTTDETALREALASGPITAYCGFDPTAPSLHFGNLVQLVLLRRLQRAGHRVICLVGGSTGLVGDPRPTAERVLKTKEEAAANVARIKALVRPFLDFDGTDPAAAHPAILVDNLDWTAPMSALDFLRDIGKHFRVNQMIRKESVARRLESQEGISYTEFSYQLLQALDYLELYRVHGCTLQTGGSDQWGNLTAGVDLIHRAEGVSVHALATPLLTDSSGSKFGKSEGNAVWLSADMTSPYAFYQYFLNVEDASVISLLKVFSDLGADAIAELETAVAAEPFRRAAQRTLAAEITTLVHSSAATAAAQAASEAIFGKGDLAALDAQTWRDAAAELPRGEVAVGATVVDALVASGLVESRNAARRVIGEGGVSVNNLKVSDPETLLGEADFLHGYAALLRRGRKAQAAAVRAG